MSPAGRSHLQHWLQMLREQEGTLPPDCPGWRGECVLQAIKAAGASAPGVDGIPYAVSYTHLRAHETSAHL
eukprot:15135496-Alexandrium_andersonii.AAC.1